MLSAALATSDLLEEDWPGLARETGLVDREVKKGMAEAMTRGSDAGMTRLLLRQCRQPSGAVA